jgi:hypothetical protein
MLMSYDCGFINKQAVSGYLDMACLSFYGTLFNQLSEAVLALVLVRSACCPPIFFALWA